MPTIELKEAVSHIVQALRDPANEDRLPFAFLIGAGVSSPVVPMAGEIESSCRLKAEEFGRTAAAPSEAPIDRYSHWFKEAYPQPHQRQDYLRSMIEGRPISAANLRLAHLLLGNAANLVITPNFDDFLSRALTLFGKQYVICDHPGTAQRIDPERTDIQLVHVHGTYRFYDCCNLTEEIVLRAEAQQNTPATMTDLLNRVLLHRSAIVVGYAGWEQDVIMGALRRRLESELRSNIYWFCYSREAHANLPEWLKDHKNVYCVLPPQIETERLSRETEDGGEPGGLQAESIERVAIDSKGEGQAVLSAQTVFDELIQALGLEAPPILSDPLSFLAEDMARQLSAEEETTDANLIYGIDEVIERIRSAREREEESEQPGVSAALEAVRNALRSSRYKDAIRDLATLQTDDLDEDQREEAVNASWTAGTGLLDDSEEELRAYEMAVKFADAIGSPGPPMRERIAKSLFYAGLTLRELGRSEEAVAAYEEVVERFGDATEPELREQVARALFNKGVRLGDLERNEEAVAAYEEEVERFGDAPEPVLREQVGKALVNKGLRLVALGRKEEAVEAFEELEARFGGAPESELRELVARALYGKGYVFFELERNEEALAAFEEVVARFGDAANLGLREQVAMALFGKGYSLGELDRKEDAVAAYDELVVQFGDASEPELREQVAKALMNKADILEEMERIEEALAAYEEIVARFGDSEEQALQDRVAHAQAQIDSAKSETEEPSEDD